jgi:hypothetical protein
VTEPMPPSPEALTWAWTVPGWAWVIAENTQHVTHLLNVLEQRLGAQRMPKDVVEALLAPLQEAQADLLRVWWLALHLHNSAAPIFVDGTPVPLQMVTRYDQPYSPNDLEAATNQLLGSVRIFREGGA